MVPDPRVEGVERAQGLPVRGDEKIDVALERDVEWKAAPELARGDPQHGFQVSPEALGRGVVEPVGDVRHGQTRVEKEVSRVEQSRAGEVRFG